MGVIEYSIAAILILGLLASEAKLSKRKYVYICMFIIFLVSALRHSTVGGDLKGYIASYDVYKHYNFNRIAELYSQEGFKDPTYYLTGWLFSCLFDNVQWWLAFIATIFCVSTGNLVYRESKNPTMSIVILIAIGFLAFSFTGLRQTIAMSLIVFSYKPLKDRKFIPFAILILIASLYHQTALVFLIAYPISRIPLGKYHIIVAGIVFVLFFAFQTQLLNWMRDYFQEERYTSYLTGQAATLNSSGFIIQSAMFIYALFYYKPVIKDNPDMIVLYNLSFIGLMFQLYSSFIAEIFRISMYFSIFNIILIPNAAVQEERNNVRIGLEMILFVILIVFSLRHGANYYKFFWETI